MTATPQTVEYTLTKDDMIHFTRFSGLNSRFGRRRRQWSPVYLGYLVLLAILAIVMHRWWVAGNFAEWTNILIAVVYAAILVVGLVFENRLRWWIWRRRVRYRLEQPAYKISFEPTRVEVTDGGVRFTTASMELFMRWRAIAGLEADRHGAYVYFSSESGQMVPRHAFSEESAFDRFVLHVKELHRQFGAHAVGQPQPA